MKKIYIVMMSKDADNVWRAKCSDLPDLDVKANYRTELFDALPQAMRRLGVSFEALQALLIYSDPAELEL